VVEDNAVNQRVALRTLEKLGLRADVAANGQEALMATAQIAYDLVLMDCHMPEMDGFMATAAIRARESDGRRTTIIALTANALTGERERCLAAGMDDYLAKPLTRDRLIAALDRWLPAAAPPAPPPTQTALPAEALDRAAFATVLGGSPEEEFELAIELIDLFFAEAQAAVAALEVGVTASAHDVVRDQAHLLKGACANLGLLHLGACCQALERLTSAGRGDEYAPAHAAFQEAYAAAVTALLQLRAELQRKAARR
jgi:CheY-like chemotaxis protein/HPt (histidine-containing phosphotransfer) domain-containing protein